MKAKLLCLFLSLGFSMNAMANISIWGGINNQIPRMSDFPDGSTPDSVDSALGYQMGPSMTLGLSNDWNLEFGLLYVLLNTRTSSDLMAEASMNTYQENYESTLSVSYLQVPVLAKYSLSSNSQLGIGGYFQKGLSAKLTEDSDEQNGEETDVELGSYGSDYGAMASLGITSGDFLVDLRYLYGLKDLRADEAVQKTQALLLMIGYRLD